MDMLKAVYIFLVGIVFFSCSGYTEIVKKDNLGRVIKVAYYNGRTLKHFEETEYYGNSLNPKIVVYYKSAGLGIVAYKEEEYQFDEKNNLASLTFMVYEGPNKKKKSGMIKYFYKNKYHSRIEYKSYSNSLNEFFMFGLDQYNYKTKLLDFRRIIEFEYNTTTGKTMQIGQYVINYDKSGKILSLKSWIMDKELKKIIQKEESNQKLIHKKIGIIEKLFNKSARGEEFLRE